MMLCGRLHWVAPVALRRPLRAEWTECPVGLEGTRLP